MKVLARIGNKMGRRFAGIIDQAFFSSVAFLQIVVLARTLSKDEFGLFGVGISISLVAVGIQRSSIILPLIVLYPTPELFRKSGHWSLMNTKFVLLTICALTLAGVFLYFLGIQSIANLLLTTAPLAAATMFYEYHRRSLYQLQLEGSVIACSAIYLFTNVLGIIAILIRPDFGFQGALLFSAVASGLSAAVAFRLRGTVVTEHGCTQQNSRSVIFWNMLSFFPYAVYNNGMVLIIGIFESNATAAVFAATRLFVAPIIALVNAIDSTDKPRAANALSQEKISGLFHSLKNTLITLLALGSPYLITTFIFADSYGFIALGEQYRGDVWIGRIWALVGFLLIFGQPLETGLIVLRRSNWLFACRSLAAVVCIGAAFMLMPSIGAAGAVIGLALGWAAAAALALLVLLASSRQNYCL